MNDHPEDARVLGSLRAADGTGTVRIEDRFDTGVDDLWSALTDPRRLARWLGEFEGSLRLGGDYHAHFFASGAEGTWRVSGCEPPHRFTVVSTGQSPEQSMEVTLAAAGDRTLLVVEQRGVPADWLAGFGAGIQVHVEDLAAHLAGRERCDSDARMGELVPAYEGIAVDG